MPPEGPEESVRADKKLSDGALVRVCDVEVMEELVLVEPAISGIRSLSLGGSWERLERQAGHDLLFWILTRDRERLISIPK